MLYSRHVEECIQYTFEQSKRYHVDSELYCMSGFHLNFKTIKIIHHIMYVIFLKSVKAPLAIYERM